MGQWLLRSLGKVWSNQQLDDSITIRLHQYEEWTDATNLLAITSPMIALNQWDKTKSNQSNGDPIANYYLKEENGANADNVVINFTARHIFCVHLGVLTSQGDT